MPFAGGGVVNDDSFTPGMLCITCCPHSGKFIKKYFSKFGFHVFREQAEFNMFSVNSDSNQMLSDMRMPVSLLFFLLHFESLAGLRKSSLYKNS